MKPIYLSIYPHIRGFGFVCMELDNRLFDFGVITSKPWDSQRLIYRFKALLRRCAPNIVVIKDANTIDSVRMRKLINELTECAIEVGVPVHQYSRDQVKMIFAPYGCTTKQQIAECIINLWLPQLAHRKPQPRGPWEPEDYNMAIFDAVALVMTHEFYAK